MAINIKSLNNGQPRSNPYGKVESIPPSFSNVDYYDCYIPYALTNEQLGGYSTEPIVDGGSTYSPMAAAIKRQRVANHPASESSYISPSLTSYTISHEESTRCKILTKTDSTGTPTKFYMTAIQPFFMRKSVGKGSSSINGFYPYGMENRGQLVDVILTDGTCIHCVVNDINSIIHTNCGNNTPGSSGFANTSYDQYHNIVSCIGGNTLELSHEQTSQPSVPLNAFSNKYGLGTWGVNGVNDIAFYRMYNTRLRDGFTLSNPSYADVSYSIEEKEPTPSTYSISITTDGNGTAYCNPSSGTQGTTVTIHYSPNSGYQFKEYEIISGGIVITNNKFTIGTSNIQIKVKFQEMSYTIPKVPYFCQYLGVVNSDTRVVSHTTEPSVILNSSGSATVANSGCGPCCASMAVSYILNQDIVVSTIIQKLGGYSSFMSGDVGNWSLGTTIGKAYGVQTKRTQDSDEALSALKQGNLVMIIVGNADVGALPSGESTKWTGHGHYILAIGVTESGKIAVHDPSSPKNSYWFKGIKSSEADWTWPQGSTVNWNQITKAARAPGNSNSPSTIATGGAYTIFYVPENRKTGSYTPPIPSSSSSTAVVRTEKGIKGLSIDWAIWKAGTSLLRIGDYVILKAELPEGAKSATWYDITDKLNPVKYTATELQRHFGISYTSVNNGYIGKFVVSQSPLSIALGGTGSSSMEDFVAGMLGTNSAPSGYDASAITAPSVGNNKITLPNVPDGQVMTAEALSDSRGGLGSSSAGDQAQAHKTTSYDNVGEVSFVYNRDVKSFTAAYRLISSDPVKAARYKQIALSAANHACFLANNANIGYVYTTKGAEPLWQYVKSNKGSVEFGLFSSPQDTSCIYLCKLVYGAAMYNSSNARYFNSTWTTKGLLSGNLLEAIGFTRLGQATAQNPSALEIGDILLRDGHAAIVVASGSKSWVLNGVDYNPKNGEVKT